MLQQLYTYLLLGSLTLATKTGVDLPLCPRHLSYFPQELPMHCRMPRNADEGYKSDGQEHNLPPNVQYPYFRRSDKEPPPVPMPIPSFPGMPGMLPGMPGPMPPGMPGPMPPGMPGPMPPGMPGPMPPGMPGPMPPGMPGPPPPGMPGMPMPMPMPLPMPMPGSPAHKLPVIVMPFYSPDRKSFTAPPHHKKHSSKRPHKKRPHYSCSSSDDSDDASDSNGSSENGWWKPPKKKKGHNKYGIYRRFNKHTHNLRRNEMRGDLLTPVLQYLTKDGYVIYEKKISKNEASNWLGSKEQAKALEEINFKKELESIPQNGQKNIKTDTELPEQEDLPIRETFDKFKASSEKSIQSIEDLYNDVKTEIPPKKIKRKRFKV